MLTIRTMEHYPLWLRLWHWTNALLFLTLVVSGFSMHFVELPLPKLSFAIATMVHNTAGVMITILYVFYAVTNIVSGNWRYYVPSFRTLIFDILRQTTYYTKGIFEGEHEPFPPTPTRKFNPLQQLTYLGVTMVGLPVLIATGLLYLFPEYLPQKIMDLGGGIFTIAVAHFGISIFLTIFLLGHIYLVTMGKTLTAEIRKMTSGMTEEEEREQEREEAKGRV